MLKKIFNSYRNKSRQVSKVKWMIAATMEKRARRLATILQERVHRVPVNHLKWYVRCFCALGLTGSLFSILTGGAPNKSVVTVKPIAATHPTLFSSQTTRFTDLQSAQQVARMERYLDSLLQDADQKGKTDSSLLHQKSIRDSIRLLKNLYRKN